MDKEEYVVTTEEVAAYIEKCEQLHGEFHEAISEVESLQELLELNWGLAAGLLNAINELKNGPDTKH